MNAKQMTMLSEDEWVVQIQDEIDALPVDVADSLTPEMMGEMDAQEGNPFAPEMYYVRHTDKCRYAVGWAAVRGASYLTDGFLVGSENDAVEHDYDEIRRGY